MPENDIPKTIQVDKKNGLIALLGIIIVIMAFFLFRKNPPAYDEKLIERLQDSARKEFKHEQEIANIHLANSIYYKRRFDSLMLLPAQIHIVYEKIESKINIAGSHALIASSDTIFANNGVK